MKHKTLFRLGLKFIGVWMTLSAISQLASGIFNWIANFAMRSRAGVPNMDLAYLIFVLAPVTEMAMGLYLFFGGKWIADLAIPSNRPYCPECGYDLTGATGNVCNECGTVFRAAPVPAAAVPAAE